MTRRSLALSTAASAMAVALLATACDESAAPSTPTPNPVGSDPTTPSPSTPPTTVVELPPTQRPDGLTVISTCDPCDLGLYTDFIIGGTEANASDLTVYTRGSFAYWWDSRYDTLDEARKLAVVAEQVQADLGSFGVSQLGAEGAGFFTNVFIHRGDDDVFPGYFGNGTGYEGDDETGGPVFAYLAYPFEEEIDTNLVNLKHEVFHLFQGAATYNGVPIIDGDGPFERAWIVEAMAEWYQMSRVGDAQVRTFENVAAIRSTPELPLWEFFPRVEPTEGDGFTEEQIESIFYSAGIRQYSNGAFFYYLTDVKGVDVKELLDAMYLELATTPQELLFNSLGAEQFRQYFTEWLTLTTADFAYLDPAQVAFAEQTFDSLTTEIPDGYLAPYAISIDGASPSGSYSPDVLHRPGAWAYNVARVTNPSAGTLSITLNGETTGSAGTAAHFDGSVLVKGSDGTWRTTELTISDAATGNASVTIGAGDTEVAIVVASMPESFLGNETFDYELTVAS